MLSVNRSELYREPLDPFANLSARLDLGNGIVALVSENVMGLISYFRYPSSHLPWFFVRLPFFYTAMKAISEEPKNLVLYFSTVERKGQYTNEKRWSFSFSSCDVSGTLLSFMLSFHNWYYASTMEETEHGYETPSDHF